MSPRAIKTLRNVVLPLNSVAIIVLLIWAVQSGLVPGLSNGSTSSNAGDLLQSDFFSLGGQPLGAAKGGGPGLGKAAPAFALQDLEGRVVHLSDFRGKVVLLNFWATWCPPCRREFPELVKAYAGGTSDVVVLGVDLQENVDQVRKFADDYGAKFPIVIDVTASVAGAYRVFGLPSSYFIDQDGILREQYFGPLNAKLIDAKISSTRAAAKQGS